MGALKKYKNIVIGVAVIIVAFIAYAVFSGRSTPSDQGLTSQTPSGLPSEDGEDLVSLLLQLKSINLSSDLFADTTFATLQDFSVELAPQPIGRRDPFATIGAVSVPAELPIGKATTTNKDVGSPGA